MTPSIVKCALSSRRLIRRVTTRCGVIRCWRRRDAGRRRSFTNPAASPFNDRLQSWRGCDPRCRTNGRGPLKEGGRVRCVRLVPGVCTTKGCAGETVDCVVRGRHLRAAHSVPVSVISRFTGFLILIRIIVIRTPRFCVIDLDKMDHAFSVDHDFFACVDHGLIPGITVRNHPDRVVTVVVNAHSHMHLSLASLVC
ncbi:hypothetical protein PSP6_270005 [Paraburkholderia tropica]|nr:hypothetical protein PSP6_270005 [Paraburkholderia tropica]